MNSLVDELRPSEVEDTRFGISSPIFVISTIAAYLVIVLRIGPSLMKNREPFRLKTVMSIYNILQVAACLYLINGIWNLTSWEMFDLNSCKAYTVNTKQRKMFDSLTYFTFWLKIFELSDTFIFVLRKKQNQISNLHVFHHSSTITLIYLTLKYYRGIGAMFPIYLNSWVHVIMYSYYFFANVCSAEVMKKFIMIKKSITIIQMVQFCAILTQAAILWSRCKVPLIIRAYYCFVVLVIFYGFYDFYKKAYLSNETNKTKNKSK